MLYSNFNFSVPIFLPISYFQTEAQVWNFWSLKFKIYETKNLGLKYRYGTAFRTHILKQTYLNRICSQGTEIGTHKIMRTGGSKQFGELKSPFRCESINTKNECVTNDAEIFHFKNMSTQTVAGAGWFTAQPSRTRLMKNDPYSFYFRLLYLYDP